MTSSPTPPRSSPFGSQVGKDVESPLGAV
jgi:hypothetical protein